MSEFLLRKINKPVCESIEVLPPKKYSSPELEILGSIEDRTQWSGSIIVG